VTTFDVHAAADGGLVVSGEVDLATAATMLKAGEDALAASSGELVVDLGEVSFIDSTGLGALVQLRNLAGAQDRSLRLEPVSRAVMRAMALAGLADLFGLSATEGD
jgi:anti-sigma B factor antagonist